MEKRIDYKDSESCIARYLRARYKFDDFDPKKSSGTRRLSTAMDEYVTSAIERFKTEYGSKLHEVASLYLPNEEICKEGTPGGQFSESCKSHAAVDVMFMIAFPE